MIKSKLQLIDEETSPLFRTMFIHNGNEPTRRIFENNVCAFHVGNGFILSVSHNLKLEANLFRSIEEPVFQSEIIPHLDKEQAKLFQKNYILDSSKKRYLNPAVAPQDVQLLTESLNAINFDKRWITLMQRNFCKPALIIQFRNNRFYQPELIKHFSSLAYMHEPFIKRHTFLLDLELVEAFYQSDIALYRIINVHPDIINALPSIAIDFSVLEDSIEDLYCLQSAPQNELGRLLNQARIDGYLDNFTFVPDRIAGNYIMDGRRYLIKGYFRFGSSGAPYIYLDRNTGTFKVNAIQSEACPIQLAIGNNREGNYQYVNAIASPLSNVEDGLKKWIG